MVGSKDLDRRVGGEENYGRETEAKEQNGSEQDRGQPVCWSVLRWLHRIHDREPGWICFGVRERGIGGEEHVGR